MYYAAKTELNNEWKSKSWQEHVIDGSISSAVWAASAVWGGTMKKDLLRQVNVLQNRRMSMPDVLTCCDITYVVI